LRISWAYIRADIPEDVRVDRIDISQLPNNWRNIPAPSSLAAIGDEWFDSGNKAVLAVPSAVNPVENNY